MRRKETRTARYVSKMSSAGVSYSSDIVRTWSDAYSEVRSSGE